MQDKEAIYDELLNPLMAHVLAICKEHGIPMFATFQYSDEAFCTSMDAIGPDVHPVLQHYGSLRQCIEGRGVNIDKYMNWNAAEARKTGHSSIWLHQAGIPEKPSNTQIQRAP